MQPVYRKVRKPLGKASYFCYGYKKYMFASPSVFLGEKRLAQLYNQEMANGLFPVIASIIRSSGIFTAEITRAIVQNL